MAGLRFGWVAGGNFAAYIGVEMSQGGHAVSGGRNGLIVDVVFYDAQAGVSKARSRKGEEKRGALTYGKDQEKQLGNRRN